MPAPQLDARLAALGRSLRRLRRERNLSQEEVATRAGIHPNHLGLIERGTKDPRITTLLRILGALGTTPDDVGFVELERVAELEREATSHRAGAVARDDGARRADLAERLDAIERLLLDIRAAVGAEQAP